MVQYRFRVENFGDRIDPYFFNLAMIIPVSESVFKFSFVPYAAYPSVLILDFLLGRKLPLSGDIISLMENYFGDVLKDSRDFVIVGIPVVGNRLEETGYASVDVVHGNRDREKSKSYIDEIAEQGLRWYVKDLKYYNDLKQLHRQNKRFLNISSNVLGLRENNFPIFLSKFIFGLRGFEWEGFVEAVLKSSGRRKIFDFIVSGGSLNAFRNMYSDATVENDLLNFYHIFERVGFNDYLIYSSLRLIARFLYKEHLNITSARDIEKGYLYWEEILSAVKNLLKYAYLENSLNCGFLKPRQYPLFILSDEIETSKILDRFTTLGSLIDLDRDIEKGEVHLIRNLIYSLKQLDRDSVIYDELGEAVKNIYRILFKDSLIQDTIRDISISSFKSEDLGFGLRDVKEELKVFDILSGYRDFISEGFINKIQLQSKRFYEKGLYLPEGFWLGYRDVKGLNVLNKFYGGLRGTYWMQILRGVSGKLPSRSLVISKIYSPGGRKKEKDGILAEFAEGTRGSGLYLNTVFGFSAFRDSKRDALLLKGDFAWRNIFKKLFINVPWEIFYGADIITQILYGFIDDSMIFGQLGVVDAGVIKDAVFGELSEIIAKVIKDMLFAYEKELVSEVYDIQFLGKVFERLALLEEAGVLSRKEELNGLLVFNQDLAERDIVLSEVEGQQVAGDILFRPADLKIENPLGYIRASFADLVGEDVVGGERETSEGEISVSSEGSISLKGEYDDDIQGSVERFGIVGEEKLGKKDFFGEYMEEFANGMVPDRQGVYDEDKFIGKRFDAKGDYKDVDFEGGSQKREFISGDSVLGNGDIRRGLYDANAVSAERGKPLGSELLPSFEGSKEERKASLTDSIFKGSLKDKLALLSTAFIFSESEEQEAVCLNELLSLLPEKYGKVLAEKYFSIKDTTRLGFELVDMEFSTGGECFGEQLSDVVSFKEAEGVVVEEEIAYKETEGVIAEDEKIAQGLIYDYTNSVLEEDINPEFWSGGFGIPEDYDPKDPFNVYYPWSEEKDTYRLLSDNWFVNGEIEVNRNLEVIRTISSSPSSSKVIYQGDTEREYILQFEFMVDGFNDKAVGVIFNYEDENNYFKFVIHGGDKDGSLGMQAPMQLYKVKDGQQIEYGSPMNPFPWVKGKLHNVVISVLDGRIKIKVDGRLQYDFVDWGG